MIDTKDSRLHVHVCMQAWNFKEATEAMSYIALVLALVPLNPKPPSKE